MSSLDQEACTACRADALPLSEADLAAGMRQLPEWELQFHAQIPRLVRTFTFPDFATAMVFTNALGDVAEAQGHHPALLTEWGSVTVSWWTHKIKGLYFNDLIMAAKTDRLFAAT
jgi:4a-hydroxytetrahydrobiopterin dehydratase